MRATSAMLSARNASAVVGAMGMKRGDGVRKIDQPSAQPTSTTLLFSATRPAATSAAIRLRGPATRRAGAAGAGAGAPVLIGVTGLKSRVADARSPVT